MRAHDGQDEAQGGQDEAQDGQDEAQDGQVEAQDGQEQLLGAILKFASKSFAGCVNVCMHYGGF